MSLGKFLKIPWRGKINDDFKIFLAIRVKYIVKLELKHIKNKNNKYIILVELKYLSYKFVFFITDILVILSHIK